VRRLILKLHLWLAMIAGAFLLVLGITGGILAFEPELDRVLHPHLSRIKPRATTLSLVQIGEAASKKYGGEPVVAYLPSSTPDVPTKVILSSGVVSVNQYTGEVLGLRTQGQTVLGFTHALHVRLATGDIGRNILRWSTVLMLISLASGLYLWWPRKRIRIRGPWWSRLFWSDQHNSFGIFSLLPLLLLTATGIVIVFEDEVSSLLDKMYGTNPVHCSQSPARSEPSQASTALTPDLAIAIASAQLPGALPYRLQMPRYGGLYVVSLAYPDNRIAAERNSISLDPRNGRTVAVNQSATLTPHERFLAANEAIHTGNILGMPTRILAALASILSPLQVISGLLIWIRADKHPPARLKSAAESHP
jgi:uncharacterized iron-regulated membrane protein